MRTVRVLLLAAFFIFSTTSFAAELVDNPVPDVEIAELENSVSQTTSAESDRAPASVDRSYASAKDRRTMVLDTISKNFPDLKSCYKEGLKHENAMKGKVVMTWDLDPHGKVIQAEVENSQLNNKRVEDCMVKRFSDWHFPSQAKIAGSKDRMTYTFHFVP